LVLTSISSFFFYRHATHPTPPSSPTRRSSDLQVGERRELPRRSRSRAGGLQTGQGGVQTPGSFFLRPGAAPRLGNQVRAWTQERSEEHTSELQSLTNLVCRLLLAKKKNNTDML